MQEVAPKRNSPKYLETDQDRINLKDSIAIWKSEYIDPLNRERLFNRQIYPLLKNIVESYAKKNFRDFQEVNYKDAAQQVYFSIINYFKDKSITEHKNPFALIFMITRSEIAKYFNESTQNRLYSGDLFELAQVRGWSFDNPPSPMDDFLIRYPELEPDRPEKIFDNSYTLKILNAIYQEWQELDEVKMNIKEWKDFFGVSGSYTGKNIANFYLQFRRSVKEYNRLYDDKIILTEQRGKNNQIVGYILHLRDQAKDYPRFKRAFYTNKLYNYLQSSNQPIVTFSCDEIRELLETSKSYDNNNRLSNNLIKLITEEINNKTDMKIKCTVDKKNGLSTTPIIGFTFHINKNTNVK